MASSDDAIALLRSIDASLKQLVRQTVKSAPVDVADDRDLDSQYGDPLVKFHPRDWTGEVCKGRKFSECPADFLDLLAETFDYFARKAEESDERTSTGKPVAPYKRKDAARARGWAKRIRNGYRAPAAVAAGGFDEPSDHNSEWPEDL